MDPLSLGKQRDRRVRVSIATVWSLVSVVFVIHLSQGHFQVGPTSNEAQTVAEVNEEQRLVLGGDPGCQSANVDR